MGFGFWVGAGGGGGLCLFVWRVPKEGFGLTSFGGAGFGIRIIGC